MSEAQRHADFLFAIYFSSNGRIQGSRVGEGSEAALVWIEFVLDVYFVFLLVKASAAVKGAAANRI